MTIAVSLKVHEGIVLATDSASTLMAQIPGGQPQVVKVFYNANKIINLLKGQPIGAMAWGLGAIGNASVASLLKDLRLELTSGENKLTVPYTIEEVAERVKSFVFDDRYEAAFGNGPNRPDLGILVAGYSSNEMLGEEYQIVMTNGVCSEPQLLRTAGQAGVTWNGQIEALTRLMIGFAPSLPQLLISNTPLSEEQVAALVPILAEQLNPARTGPGINATPRRD